MNLSKISNELEQIRQILEKQNTPSLYESYEPFFQFLFMIISVFLGAIVAYFFTKKQSGKEYKKNCYNNYLNSFNNYLADINDILIDILKINKLGNIVCGKSFLQYQITDLSDYYLVMTKVKEFRYFLNAKFTKYWANNTLYEDYFKKLQETTNKLVNFDLFIEITNNMQKSSINYYYVINDSLRKQYDDILEIIHKNTSNNMRHFDIEDFKRLLVKYIKDINNVMLKL